MGCHFLLQGIFLTQGFNPGLLHCRQTLYHLSHQGNPSVQFSCCSVVCDSLRPHEWQHASPYIHGISQISSIDFNYVVVWRIYCLRFMSLNFFFNDLIWRTFHVHWRRRYILFFLLGDMFSRCLLGLIGP